MDPETVATMAARGVEELREFVPELAAEKHLEIESYRWPSSIHVVPPGFFTHWVKVLKPPFGRIHFAGSNLGTPSFEEALYRGWCAAEEVLKLLAGQRTKKAA
jgi:monoamine oxidase